VTPRVTDRRVNSHPHGPPATALPRASIERFRREAKSRGGHGVSAGFQPSGGWPPTNGILHQHLEAVGTVVGKCDIPCRRHTATTEALNEAARRLCVRRAGRSTDVKVARCLPRSEADTITPAVSCARAALSRQSWVNTSFTARSGETRTATARAAAAHAHVPHGLR